MNRSSISINTLHSNLPDKFLPDLPKMYILFSLTSSVHVSGLKARTSSDTDINDVLLKLGKAPCLSLWLPCKIASHPVLWPQLLSGTTAWITCRRSMPTWQERCRLKIYPGIQMANTHLKQALLFPHIFPKGASGFFLRNDKLNTYLNHFSGYGLLWGKVGGLTKSVILWDQSRDVYGLSTITKAVESLPGFLSFT